MTAIPFPSRRELVGLAAGLAASGTVPARAARPDQIGPGDDGYWRSVAAQFDLPPGIVQLENGNWGAMAKPVLAAYQRKLAEVNAATSFYARRGFGDYARRVRARVAADLGVAPGEIVFTRGATEALKMLIGNYNRLRPGDQLLYADLDYDSMQAAFRSLARRTGCGMVTIALPEPASHQGLIDAYAAALNAHPRVRLILLTHVSHRTGLVLPIREIVAMARARGVDAIVDSAHAWGQLDVALPDLDADFVGLTCQKWIGAPMGIGLAYIRTGRLDAIDRDPCEDDESADTSDRRVHTGTASLATILAVEDALEFHQRIGARRKETRLRHLRDRWAERLRGHPGLQILTPPDARLTCAITSFRLTGKTSAADNREVAARLLREHRIYTVDREGPAAGSCVRVTPAIFTSEDDIDRFCSAVDSLLVS